MGLGRRRARTQAVKAVAWVVALVGLVVLNALIGRQALRGEQRARLAAEQALAARHRDVADCTAVLEDLRATRQSCPSPAVLECPSPEPAVLVSAPPPWEADWTEHAAQEWRQCEARCR